MKTFSRYTTRKKIRKKYKVSFVFLFFCKNEKTKEFELIEKFN